MKLKEYFDKKFKRNIVNRTNTLDPNFFKLHENLINCLITNKKFLNLNTNKLKILYIFKNYNNKVMSKNNAQRIINHIFPKFKDKKVKKYY